MRPQLLALVTAVAWGVGGYFEKRGLQLGHLPAQVGITIRTAVALVVLGAWFGGEHLAWREILGIALTTGGIVLLTGR